jgi:trinucleotide repeat-containing gene 6 protein
MRYGNSLIRYGSKDQAASARNVLNGTLVQGGQLAADFATDGDIAGFFEQPVDWSTSPFPSNSTFGNHWSFQNIIGSGSGPGETSSAAPGMQRPTSNPDQGIPSEDKPTTSIPPMTGGPPPNMQWGNSGPAHVPSQLWGAPMPGTNTGFSSQVPSMWSFGTSANNEGPPQPGASENGLVSPSMATFLPPGLLNGGESV